MAKLYFINGVTKKIVTEGLANALCNIHHTYDKPLLSAFKCDHWASEAERVSGDWCTTRHRSHSTHDIPYQRIESIRKEIKDFVECEIIELVHVYFGLLTAIQG